MYIYLFWAWSVCMVVCVCPSTDPVFFKSGFSSFLLFSKRVCIFWSSLTPPELNCVWFLPLYRRHLSSSLRFFYLFIILFCFCFSSFYFNSLLCFTKVDYLSRTILYCFLTHFIFHLAPPIPIFAHSQTYRSSAFHIQLIIIFHNFASLICSHSVFVFTLAYLLVLSSVANKSFKTF